MPDVFIALGSNLDQPLKQVEQACRSLHTLQHSEFIARSSWYRSKAVGPGEQDDYINGVCQLRTHLAPLDLLDALQNIEAQQHRKRLQRWGPRTLDLDILLYGTERLALPRLQVPHPRMYERNFVLYPLYELTGDIPLPAESGLPKSVGLESLLSKVDDSGLQRLSD